MPSVDPPRNEREKRGVTPMPRKPAISTETGPGASPPRAGPPTTDRLRIDIDRGVTGEKVDYIDPAAAPLGTDDEAAGHPASAQERRMEAEARALPDREDGKRRKPALWLPLGGLLFVLLLLATLLVP